MHYDWWQFIISRVGNNYQKNKNSPDNNMNIDVLVRILIWQKG